MNSLKQESLCHRICSKYVSQLLKAGKKNTNGTILRLEACAGRLDGEAMSGIYLL